MRDDTLTRTDRGQAYTLEGFIGAMVVLMAVLFALQSVVITPTTGGLADRTVQQQIQQETQDALVVANQDGGNLSEMARYWVENGDNEFENTSQSGPNGYETYTTDAFASDFTLGEILDKRFGKAGWSYNVALHYEDADGNPANRSLVYQGSPPTDAVTASYTIALYQEQNVTSVDGPSLNEAYDGGNGWAAIPPLEETANRNEDYIYNVVEVRVIVW